MAYATVDELDEFLGRTPANAQQLLDRASRDVDRALLTSVYDVQETATVAALKEATLEQIAANLDAGNLTGSGASAPSSGFSIGRITVQKQGRSGTQATGQADKIQGLWPQAWTVLQLAGLTGQGPGESGYGLG